MKREIILMIVVAVLMTASCKGTAPITQIPVYIHDTTYVKQTEEVERHDSVFINTETIVREADSATLAMLGIQLKNNERAIMVLQRELIERTRQLSEQKGDTTYLYKDRPVTVTKTVEVARPLRWWQKLLAWLGALSLLTLIGYAAKRYWIKV